MADKYGGYDYDFCEPLPDECPCTVCTLVQREPHQLTCCGRIFCKSCLHQMIKSKNRCPNCRDDSIREEKYFPDMNTDRKIKSLRIRCPNKENGCTWTGPLRDLDKKHIPQCLYQLVPCPNKKNIIQKFFFCNTIVQRHQLEKHMKEECQWRVVSCEHCGEEDTFHRISGEHIQTCPDLLLPCSNDGCELKIKRCKMKAHLKTCPKGIIACQYSSLGCKSRVKREDTQSHTQEAMAAHLEMTTDALKRALKRIDKLENCKKETSDTLKQALQRIQKLENSRKSATWDKY